MMAVKTIETRAVISAQDRTGATFAQVAQKLRHIEGAAAGASRRMDGVASRMSAVGRSAQFHKDIAARMGAGYGAKLADIERRGTGLAITPAMIGAAAAAGATAMMAAPIIKNLVDAAHRKLDEKLSQDIAGMDPREKAQIASAAQALSEQHKSISTTQAEGLLRGARTIVGDTKGAIEIGPTLSKLAVILKRQNPEEDVNKALEDFTKAADAANATKDAKTFEAFANSYAKVLGAFPSAVPPFAYREFTEKAHGAALGLSPEFMGGIAPSLIQSRGGSGTGEMVASFMRNIVDNRLDAKAKKTLGEYGLIDKGGKVVGRELAASDPYRWTNEILAKALARKGVTDPQKQADVAGGLFSDSTAAELVRRFLVTRDSIERDRQKAREAMDLGAAAEIEKRDLGTASLGVKAQFENVSSTIGERFTPALLDASKGLSEFLANTQRQLASQPQFGPELGETAVIGGPRNPLTPLRGLWDQFRENSRPQISMKFGGDIPESVTMPREAMDLSGSGAIPAGPAKFGFGAGGVSAQWAALAAGLRGGTIRAEAELKGAADVGLRVTVEPSTDFMVKVDQRIDARGALRTDGGASTGVSMPMER